MVEDDLMLDPEETEPKSAGDLLLALSRQRRLLILTSLALAGFYALGAQLKHHGEYTGLAINLLKPERAAIGLWLIWGWGLWRYWQHFNRLWDQIRDSVLADVAVEDMRVALRAARRFGAGKIRRGEGRQGMTNINVSGDAYITPSTKDYIRSSRQPIDSKTPPKRDPPFESLQNGGRAYPRLCIPIAGDTKDGRMETGFDFSMEFSPLRLRVHRLHAWFRALARLPAITEYLAPFAIAIAALLCVLLFSAKPPFEPCL